MLEQLGPKGYKQISNIYYNKKGFKLTFNTITWTGHDFAVRFG